MKLIASLIVVFWLRFPVFESFGQRDTRNTVFMPGEMIRYEIAYNWGYLWVNAGEVHFKTDTVVYKNIPCWYFESSGQTYKFYDWFFKVRNSFQSKVSRETFQPVWFRQHTYEGGYEVNNRFEFDHQNNEVAVSMQNSNRRLTVDTLKFPPHTFDVLSAIYHVRSINFDGLQSGEKVPVHFIIEGEFFELFIRYHGKESVKNRDGKIYDCIKFSALLVDGTIFKGGEDLIVWVTDDANKLPIMAEAKILIGSVKAYLIEHQNLIEELRFRQFY